MATSRRCSNCGTDWPYWNEFTVCPFCEVDTWPCNDSTPLTKSEADQLIAKHTAELRAQEELDRKMDAAFDSCFLRENGIAPWDAPAKHGQTAAPLSEFLPL